MRIKRKPGLRIYLYETLSGLTSVFQELIEGLKPQNRGTGVNILNRATGVNMTCQELTPMTKLVEVQSNFHR